MWCLDFWDYIHNRRESCRRANLRCEDCERSLIGRIRPVLLWGQQGRCQGFIGNRHYKESVLRADCANPPRLAAHVRDGEYFGGGVEFPPFLPLFLCVGAYSLVPFSLLVVRNRGMLRATARAPRCKRRLRRALPFRLMETMRSV